MQTGTTVMSRELPVKLTEHEVAERAESMAAKLIQIGSLRKKRREDLRSINALIESELDEVQRIARVIADGVEARKQSDIKFGDEVVPSQAEATQALAEVAKFAERYHRNGALCRKDPCKRAHHAPEALRAQGIKVEGDELAPAEGEPPLAETCGGCDKQLEGIERVKRLCETCQTSDGGDPLEGTPDAAALDELAQQLEAADIEGVIPEDDPRPRCHIAHCRAVLDADEVEREHGVCSKHDPGVEKPQQEGDEQPAPPAA